MRLFLSYFDFLGGLFRCFNGVRSNDRGIFCKFKSNTSLLNCLGG